MTKTPRACEASLLFLPSSPAVCWLVQDRFHHVVPTLSKYSSTTVALTLVVIGTLGLQETLQTRKEARLQLVGTGAVPTLVLPSGIPGCTSLCYSMLAEAILPVPKQLLNSD